MPLWTSRYMYLFKLIFSICLDIHPGLKLLDHMISLFLVFWATYTLFSTVGAQNCIPNNSVPFISIFSSTFVVCSLFDDSHSVRCEVISHLVLICIAWIISNVESVHVPLGHLYIFFGEISIQVFCPLKKIFLMKYKWFTTLC